MTEAKKFGEARNAETGEVLAQFFGPGKSEDALSIGLEILTCVLQQQTPESAHRGGFFGGAFGYGVDFENDVFEMHPYWWGDCTCGYEDRSAPAIAAWNAAHHHAPDCYNTELQEARKAAGLSYIDNLAHEFIHVESGRSYAKDQQIEDVIYKRLMKKHHKPAFGCAQHCTCGHESEWRAFLALNDHSPRCGIVRPNFQHKASGFSVRWYKYIGRDNKVSDDALTSTQWRELLEDCLVSLGTNLAASCALYKTKSAEAAESAQKAMEFVTSPEGQRVFKEMVEHGAIRTFSFGGDDEK